MLVLSRRPSERIVFPDLNITVEVTSVKGRVVRLGITAPTRVTVFREEVLPPNKGRPGSILGIEREQVPVTGMARQTVEER
jgi:carbon storage regulator